MRHLLALTLLVAVLASSGCCHFHSCGHSGISVGSLKKRLHGGIHGKRHGDPNHWGRSHSGCPCDPGGGPGGMGGFGGGMGGAMGPGMSGPGGGMGAVAYPYYTTRGPRDFLVDQPSSIGP